MTTPTPVPSGLLADLEALVKAALAQPKSGLKTSEFLVVAVALLDDFLLARFGHDWGLKGNQALVVGLAQSGLSAAYALARTHLKVTRAKTVAAALPAAAQVAVAVKAS